MYLVILPAGGGPSEGHPRAILGILQRLTLRLAVRTLPRVVSTPDLVLLCHK